MILNDWEIRSIGEKQAGPKAAEEALKSIPRIYLSKTQEEKDVKKIGDSTDPKDTVTVSVNGSPPFSGVDSAFPPGNYPGRPIDWRALPHINIPPSKDIADGKLTLPKTKILDVEIVGSTEEKQPAKGAVKADLLERLTKELGEDCWVKNINDISDGSPLKGENAGGTGDFEEIVAIPDEGNEGAGQNVYLYKDNTVMLVTSSDGENQALIKYPDGRILSKEWKGKFTWTEVQELDKMKKLKGIKP